MSIFLLVEKTRPLNNDLHQNQEITTSVLSGCQVAIQVGTVCKPDSAIHSARIFFFAFASETPSDTEHFQSTVMTKML